MKSFNEWLELRESVTFTVQGWQPERKIARDLLELSYHI